MEDKKLSIKIISVKKESSNVIIFKAKFGDKTIEDRCKISGIKNIVDKKIDHPWAEIYKAALKSLGGKKDDKEQSPVNK